MMPVQFLHEFRRANAVHEPNSCPPIGTFRDFYAFEEHVKTCRAQRGRDMIPSWYRIPVFYFSNPHSLIHHEQPAFAPIGSQQLDYELELGVVIGKPGINIQAPDAWDHVAGITIINDLSARDLQREEMQIGIGPSKGKDFATAVGPVLVPVDPSWIVDDHLSLDMHASVNGRTLSRGQASSMHFTWPELIAHASRDAMLYPGDLLGSGTVGSGCILELGPENTDGWLEPGDVVELTIDGIGTLRTPIIENPHH